MKRLLLRLAYRLYRWQAWLTRPIMLGVRIILVQNEGVLLVRHSYQDQWYFPGGAVKRGETLVQAAMREALEEVGATFAVEPTLLGVYTSFYEGKSDHIAVFYSDTFVMTTPTDRWEIAQRATFALDSLPADLSPGTSRRLRDYLAGQGPYSGKW